jgi:hypothetical protein
VVYATETLTGHPETVLIHVEVESTYRRAFDQRMAHYGLSLHLRTGNPVLPIALLLKGGSRDGALDEGGGLGWKTVEMAVPGSWINRFRYLAFSLSASTAEAYLGRRNPLAAALAALMPYRAGSPADHKLECLRGIAAARGLDAARSFQLANIVENYLQLEATEQDRFRKQIIESGDTEVQRMELLFDRMLRQRHDEGLKQGRDLGLKQGMLEGARQTLLRLLQLRFGPLPEAVTRRVASCEDFDTLQGWSEGAVHARDLGTLGF